MIYPTKEEREKAELLILERLQKGVLSLEESTKILKDNNLPLSKTLAKEISWKLSEEGKAFFNDQWLLQLSIMSDDLETIIEIFNELVEYTRVKFNKYFPENSYTITTESNLKKDEFKIKIQVGYIITEADFTANSLKYMKQKDMYDITASGFLFNILMLDRQGKTN
jgi:hypothetical protein